MIGRLSRIVGLAGLVLFSAHGLYAEGAAGIQGSTGPAAAGAPPQVTEQAVTCNQAVSPHSIANGPISVTVNAATTWQPRGGEVLIAVNGEAPKLAGLTVLSCFAWSRAPAQDYFSAANLAKTDWYEAFVVMRPSDQIGLRNLGVIVPSLPWSKSSIWSRWFSTDRSSGLGLVPVVDVRLIGYTPSGVLFDEVRPVGITSVPYALFVALATLVILIAVLNQLAVTMQGKASMFHAIASGSWILVVVQNRNGRASLSAFQILFWTLIVAASAAYVMALSGNLVNIPLGLLTLLGIAGTAGVISAFAANPNEIQKTLIPSAPVSATSCKSSTQSCKTTPHWRDLVLTMDGKAPDISRVQMLVFTLVGGCFVVLQVLNYYVIPDIPAGYQILIGISNGIYVGSKDFSTGSKPDPQIKVDSTSSA